MEYAYRGITLKERASAALPMNGFDAEFFLMLEATSSRWPAHV